MAQRNPTWPYSGCRQGTNVDAEYSCINRIGDPPDVGNAYFRRRCHNTAIGWLTVEIVLRGKNALTFFQNTSRNMDQLSLECAMEIGATNV